MAHKINVKHMYRLDSPERRKMLPPEETLFNAGLTKNDIFIDIGCGIGYFSIPASKIVGPKGKVFALDTSKEMLEELNRRINEDKITGQNLNGLYQKPPDLFVKELTRECIEQTIQDLLKIGDLEKVLNQSIYDSRIDK
mgnify:CR=1 FL=1